MRGDLLLSALFTALSVVMYIDAATLPKGLFGTLGPGFFPKLVLGCLIIASGSLTVRLLLRAFFTAKQGAASERGGAPSIYKRYRFVAITFVAFFIYLYAMKWIGFLLATFIFMAGTMWLLAPSEKNWGTIRIIALTTVLLTFGLYGLFTYAFTVILPSGALF